MKRPRTTRLPLGFAAALLLLCTVGCAATPRPGPSSQRRVTGVAAKGDGRLDALAFLEGCWQHWSVDWGFSLCWKRHRNAWVGELTSAGPMGPKTRLELRIMPGVRALEVSVTGDLGGWFKGGMRNVELTVSARNHVRFGSGAKVLELRYLPKTRELRFRPWKGPSYDLK
jgi:hypothetical protein